MARNGVLLAGAGIDVAFGGNHVLAGVDVDGASGEIVTLIGPNGAGKTTLVRVLLGLLRPDGGTVRRRSTSLSPTSAGGGTAGC